MTAKKVISKKVEPKPKVELKPKPKQEYKPIFCIPIVEKRIIKRDLNYFGIKQYLKNHIGIDLFKKLKNGDEKKEIKEPKKKFNYAEYYEDMNKLILNYWVKILMCWVKYCAWFNKVVNKHE